MTNEDHGRIAADAATGLSGLRPEPAGAVSASGSDPIARTTVMDTPEQIDGRCIKISEAREVWIASAPFNDGSFAVHLTNRENQESGTSLRLSAEALDALTALWVGRAGDSVAGSVHESPVPEGNAP